MKPRVQPNAASSPQSAERSSTEERLRRECLRLSRRLAAERDRNDALRQAVTAMLSSMTFRAAASANRVLSSLLRMKRGPTAWDQLPVLLDEQGSGVDPRENLKLSRTALLHAEASCNRAGLTRLQQEPGGGWLLIIGSPLPFSYFGDHRQITPEEDFDDLAGCRGVLALALGDGAAEVIDRAESAANLSGCPLAVWSDREVPGLPDATQLAGPSFEGQPNHQQPIDDPLTFQRWLGQLRARSIGSSEVPFTETAYLRSNPDVLEAIVAGDFESAREHWKLIGRAEFAEGSRACHLRRDEPTLGLRTASDALKSQARTEWEGWDYQPTISVLVPVYRVDLRWLKACVDSVREQIYPFWELCLVDDASEDPAIEEYLQSLDDPRIRVELLSTNAGISAASNAALALATGDHVALLDHDDELTVDALWLAARVIVRHRSDIIYSDEAKLDDEDRIVEPHFKPDFSWPMLLSQNYVSHLGIYRRELVNSVGGFRTGFEGSQDHDLLLRVASVADSIFHITRVLYYWRKVPGSTAQRFGDKDYAWDRGVSAVSDCLGELGAAKKGPYPGTYRAVRHFEESPAVAVLVPFRDEPAVLETCLESLTSKTEYRRYEVIGVNNQSRQKRTRRLMDQWSAHERVRFVDFDQPFNFSAINNFAAEQTDAEHLLLLNNDIEILEEGWLRALVEHSIQPQAGAVGGLLLYPDQTIQHAGVILGIGGVAGHSHKYLPSQHHGYFCRPHLDQNVSAVTGACLMVKRRLYLEAGGLDDQNLSVAFNDVDFCLRLLELGYRNIYTPRCRVVHHESKSRGTEDTPAKQRRFNREAAFMRQRHSLALCLGDPFYNPSLSPVTEDFSLRPDVQQLLLT
ncbi:MAG: glycosyltransferase [Pseudomonadota bacterium]